MQLEKAHKLMGMTRRRVLDFQENIEKEVAVQSVCNLLCMKLLPVCDTKLVR